ncbi:MAG: TatD family nuclease-associated radical SAM protein [Endomicrobiia bacterium]|nr:TatD family nuclease-associated radical SAM protein [Endomicrobiia bacterium]
MADIYLYVTQTVKHMSIVYPYHGALYVNLTNRCPCGCVYCIKNKWEWRFRGHDLKLKTEPSAAQVLSEIKKFDLSSGSQIKVVFCGYGEPFMRADVMGSVAAELKKTGRFVRVNTTGLLNLRAGQDALAPLVGVIDAICVSLNAATPEEYVRVNRPTSGVGAFGEVLDFISRAVSLGFDVTVTSVKLPGADIAAIKKIAERLGAKFRSRDYLDEYEDV